MGAEVTYSSDNAADGTFVRFVRLNTHPKVFEVHFVERRADDRGGYTVGDIEGYYKAVHAAKVHSPYCGFDTWFDNHIGVDMCNGMGACARARARSRGARFLVRALVSRWRLHLVPRSRTPRPVRDRRSRAPSLDRNNAGGRRQRWMMPTTPSAAPSSQRASLGRYRLSVVVVVVVGIVGSRGRRVGATPAFSHPRAVTRRRRNSRTPHPSPLERSLTRALSLVVVATRGRPIPVLSWRP